MSELIDLRLPAALQWACRQLSIAGVPSPQTDARELAMHITGKHLALSEPEFTLKQGTEFARLVKLRAQRIPLQHLLGKMWFRYLELRSTPDVFIVRPETELIAEAAITEIKRLENTGEKNPLVLDLCTGSGAIALAAATETGNKNVHAVEISAPAYRIALENNTAYGNLVHFHLGDALSELNDFAAKVAVITANPPYVPQTHQLSPEVCADPALALFGGGTDGLDFPRKLIARAAFLLRPGGLLLMEHADEQGPATRALARASKMQDISTGTDLAGKPRYLTARKTRVF